ncbi:MAG: hypothetical protein GY722_23750 [bacterium]|nr:hypothetical protein [bacterium]
MAENIGSLVGCLLCGEAPEREERLIVTQHALLVPLQLHPGWISKDEVEAFCLGEDLRECGGPVMEVGGLRCAGGDIEAFGWGFGFEVG